jgi:hypothetical protein
MWNFGTGVNCAVIKNPIFKSLKTQSLCNPCVTNSRLEPKAKQTVKNLKKNLCD